MKKVLKYLMAIPLALIIISPAQAHRSHDGKGIRIQMSQQSGRIEKGIQSGKLTRREARALRYEQRNVRELAWAFRQDGILSDSERHILRTKMKRVNHKIRRFKHNDNYKGGTQRHRENSRTDHFRYSPSRYWQ